MTRSRLRKLKRVRSGCTRAAIKMMSVASAICSVFQPALAQEKPAASDAFLEEIVVTAQKRNEDLQHVPLSITTIGTKELEQLDIQKADDYIRLLPSVTSQGGGSAGGVDGPGHGRVIMRGISSDAAQNHSGPLPTVGTYLDDQPITTIQGAMDVHLYDIARIEALAGPQGTLYGASSEAGTLRIITNKPDPSAFKGAYEVEGNWIDHGGPGGLIQGFLNVPIGENAAVRAVGWYEHTGGYIDNVPGTRTYPQFGITIDNSGLVKKDYNDVTLYGARAALKVDLNDNWTITPFVMGQETIAHGFGNAFNPSVGDLEITRFRPDDLDDRFIDTALTIEGKISNFDLVYSGAYLDRHEVTHTDYSDYSLAYDIAYPSYNTPVVDNSGNHIDPTQSVWSGNSYTKQSHELRLQSPVDQRLRYIVGALYQRQTHLILAANPIDNLAQSRWVTGWPDIWWLTLEERVDRDNAIFGETTFDISPSLSATAGLRHFNYDNTLEGFLGYGAGNPRAAISGYGETGSCNYNVPFHGAPCLSFSKGSTGSGNTPKFTLTYKFDPKRLVYFTYSKGFRPGGINRAGNLPSYQADFLKNYEVGWKTTWLDNRVRFNGAFFREDWDNFQFAFLGSNSLTRIANAGAARVTGFESSLEWAVSSGLSLAASLSLLDPKLTENYCGAIDANGNAITNCPSSAVPNAPLAPKGTQLPSTSKVKGNIVARYEFSVGGFSAYSQGVGVFQSAQWDDLRIVQREQIGQQAEYGTLDLAFGLGKNIYKWDLFLSNVLDRRGQAFRFNSCGSCGMVANYVTTIQPRTIALKFSQKF